MDYIEKLIKALECCLNKHSACKTCPFNDYKHCQTLIMKIALSTIKSYKNAFDEINACLDKKLNKK